MDKIEKSDFKREGVDLSTLEKETPTESLPVEETKPEVKEEVEVKPEEGENTPKEEIPFHEHPRWKAREEELGSLRESLEQNQRELAELKAQKTEPTDTTIPDWFKELYGENESAYRKYSEHELSRTAEIERQILTRQEQAQAQQQQEMQKWQKWVDSEFTKLESEGKKFDRNKLTDILLKFKPTDENNNFNFKAGYEIYEALEPKIDSLKSQARKELADTTTGSHKGEQKAKDYLTSDDLRNKTWHNL